MSKKAIIAMSGGVDSSVAALLTKQTGDECTGIMLKLYNNEDIGVDKHKTCCSAEDAEDARRVAFRLDMPFYVFNFTDDFKGCVIDEFVKAYQCGCTPNPCIDCNRTMKFGKLYHRMLELGMDYIVTGHYVQAVYDEERGRYLLKKAVDPNKDQSYVLYMLTQEQLAHVRFPLGGIHKDETRRIAEENGFINARKRDSQDICFVPDGDYAKVIQTYSGNVDIAGEFVDREGNVLGLHEGITHYTIGQRRGLRVSAKQRLYVTDIQVDTNKVVLGSNEDLFQRELVADQVNLILYDELKEPIRVQAKIRYRHKEQPAIAWQDEKGLLHVKFDEPQRAITKGQSVVMYDGDIVVGGGVIKGVVE